ncbi:uncharacterized protein LOC119991395 isoform X2 [Tripterygium wilfordii]|uniref:uncharacterized protein LOC119991395 isoform X2 n=1 Tax=Tripterygium wilfordii TaxID=458696 RepID=UPI0018F838A0|nr:uncharacterized protein LOC119991395 isoform X2 [Tripterygium wilfordii]
METVVGGEGNDEGKLEESAVQKSSSDLSSSKGIADPVVYKLVRVEGDGRLVPATDDEVMEVEGLLDDEKSELQSLTGSDQIVQTIFNESSLTGIPQIESSGLSQSENTEDTGKLNSRLEGNHTSVVPTLSGRHVSQSEVAGECSKSRDELREGGSSTCGIFNNSKPDFSIIKGEICLDKMSIKELHETFKATFGRETTVKDKQWLKRRIAMGLTNSCDVPNTSFIIRDNKLVKTGEEERSNSVYNILIEDPTVKAVIGDCDDSTIAIFSPTEDYQIVSDKRLRDSIDTNSGAEEASLEQRAAKRVRKPTKRYIEELSEAEFKECSGKTVTSAKYSGLGLMSQKTQARPARNSSLDGRNIITRLDSLGGFGVHVPCVSRVRRSRPRKNIMGLMKFHPDGEGMMVNLVEDALGVNGSHLDDGCGNKDLKTVSAPDQSLVLCIAESDIDKKDSAMDVIKVEQSLELKHVCSLANTTDGNIATVPTSKGGIRRKHHRAWSLAEVMKLVEGVARYGAGRWSEIKRLAFASYSYRTSVDLKDKWRNLLKASFAPTTADKGINSKKQAASMPIPAPVLVRVRELAEMHAQVPPSLGSNKLAKYGNGGRSVHETRSGYL